MHRRKSRPWLTKTTIFARKAARRSQQGLRDGILDVTGLVLLSVGGFTINSTVGFVVAGIACFWLRWGMQDGRSS